MNMLALHLLHWHATCDLFRAAWYLVINRNEFAGIGKVNLITKYNICN
jgi:hypothetical protein